MNRTPWFVLLLAIGVALAPAGAARAEDPAPKKPAGGAPAATPGAKADPKVKEASKATESKPREESQPKEDAKAKDDPNLGMSILGNQEAPKSLVIVPWKSSEVGNSMGLSTLLDDSRQPIDKEVFMRMLSYYDIRSETAPHVGAPEAGRETAPAERKTAQPASAAHRRKP